MTWMRVLNPTSLQGTWPLAALPKLTRNGARKGVKTDTPDSAPPRRRVKASSALTIDGLLFITLGLMIGLSALNTGQNLLYLILSMMISMLIVSLLLARNNLRRLSVQRNYPLEFYAGQNIQGTLEIHNGKRLFYSYAIGLHEVIGGPARGGRDLKTHSYRSFAMIVPPGKQTHCAIAINLPARGLYTIRQARIISRFPFGFFEKMRTAPEAAKILVFPRLIPAYALLAHCPQFFGETETERKGRGGGIFGVRDYQSGDPARLIHWKISAKGHGIKLKEFEQEESRSYRLMLDLRCPDNPSAALLADFEKAVSVTATLARMMLKQGAMVALWTTVGNVPRGNGIRHLQRILRAMAQVEPMTPQAKVAPPELNDREAIEVWVDFMPVGGEGAFQPEPVVRRAPNHRVVDARKIEMPEDPPQAVVIKAGME